MNILTSILLQNNITIGEQPTPSIDSLQTAMGGGADELNLIDLSMKGGWIMIPIFALSIVAVYIFVERWMALQKAKKEDNNFMNEIKRNIQDGKIDQALSICHMNNTPLSRMIEKGIMRIGRDLSDVNAAIENVGKLEVNILGKGLPTLATVSGAAPMIGFLGTVMGMIKAFYDMANVEGGNISMDLLSNGIYTAMVTTVAGLTVGIIAYLGYNILVAKLDSVINLLEARTTEFMDLLHEPA